MIRWLVPCRATRCQPATFLSHGNEHVEHVDHIAPATGPADYLSASCKWLQAIPIGYVFVLLSCCADVKAQAPQRVASNAAHAPLMAGKIRRGHNRGRNRQAAIAVEATDHVTRGWSRRRFRGRARSANLHHLTVILASKGREAGAVASEALNAPGARALSFAAVHFGFASGGLLIFLA